jgi:hypothetical protein
MRQRVMTHSLAISSATACADLAIAPLYLLCVYLFAYTNIYVKPPSRFCFRRPEWHPGVGD